MMIIIIILLIIIEFITYKDLTIELQSMWNEKTKEIPVIKVQNP